MLCLRCLLDTQRNSVVIYLFKNQENSCLIQYNTKFRTNMWYLLIWYLLIWYWLIDLICDFIYWYLFIDVWFTLENYTQSVAPKGAKTLRQGDNPRKSITSKYKGIVVLNHPVRDFNMQHLDGTGNKCEQLTMPKECCEIMEVP